MNWSVEWVHTPLAVGVGWGLLHFVWQGALVAMALAVLLWVNRRASATLRYGLACAAMAAMAAAFALTVANLIPAGEERSAILTPYASVGGAWASLPATPVNWTLRLTAILPACLPWVVSAWLAGVFLFYFRTLSGWIAVKRLSARGVRAVPLHWEQRLSRLASWLKVRQPVRILESCLTEAPVVIGWLRPVILVPASMLTTLAPGQIESILAHELAHIRRHDYLVNLLQRMVAGLLFYHPAVWWVSAQIRAERENCCDDVAVAACGDVHGYASALATLEQDRWGTS